MDRTNGMLLDAACEAALTAEKIHKKYAAEGVRSASKSAVYDLVTNVDTESEQAVVEVLQNFFPDHNIVGEENQYRETDSPYTWFIDPLDGTNNFTKGIPHYSVSLGLAKNGFFHAGVVLDTAKNELFKAVRGEGAFFGDIPIRVSDVSSLEGAMLYTGFHYDRGDYMRGTLRTVENFFEESILGIRRSGSAALDLCYLACGRADGFWEHYLSPWDTAAGVCILQEAGGTVTDFRNRNLPLSPSTIIASNSRLHNAMLSVISHTYPAELFD